MKLEKQDLNELIKRTEQINSHKLIVQALEIQKQFWLSSKFEKYGLDKTKKYNFNMVNKKIEEVNI